MTQEQQDGHAYLKDLAMTQPAEYQYTEQDLLVYTRSLFRTEFQWKKETLNKMDSSYISNTTKYLLRETNNLSIFRKFYGIDARVWFHLMMMELKYRSTCELMIANMPGLTEEDFDIPKIPMKIFLDKGKI